MAPSTPKLFMPVTLGGKSPIQLKHRVAMAPLTRLRTGAEGEPKAVAAEYYSQRTTDGGLIVTEATDISKQGNGYYGAPGLYTQEQVEAWKPVTKAIHEKGGKVFVQLWHTGRVSHPLNQPNGGLPVSASATSMEAVTSHAVTAEGRKDHVTPRALEVDEIPGIVEDYKTATKNALAAGFDGVELHAANGYLLEQFLCDATNKRTDKYGGSIDNRARFLFEAIEGILSVADSSKVAIRLSPYGITFACTDSNPLATYGYVIRKLNDYDLAYVHLVEPNGWHFTGPLVPEGGISPVLRPLYKGVIVAAGGFNREKAIKNVEEGYDDIIAFGRDFIGTPDIVERLKADQPLNEYNTKTFYPRAWTDVLEEGYTDYPFWHEKLDRTRANKNTMPEAAKNDISSEITEQEYRKISSRPHLKHNDMTAEVCTETIEIITMACDKHVPVKNYEAAAQLIKQSMDKKFGSSWHCFIGEGYGFDISYQQRHMLYLYVGEIGVLVYKC
ncbi:hypothetical protein JG687_00014456 [Phytophthora cactorum]|nr:hypothetical protein JG687_00014456 [Phytophthora cactorum]